VAAATAITDRMHDAARSTGGVVHNIEATPEKLGNGNHFERSRPG